MKILNLSQMTYLAEDIEITQSGHVWMSPSMNGNVMSRVEGREEVRGIIHDVDTNHEVRCGRVVGRQELHKGWRRLQSVRIVGNHERMSRAYS
jgi:hypothetical protein